MDQITTPTYICDVAFHSFVFLIPFIRVIQEIQFMNQSRNVCEPHALTLPPVQIMILYLCQFYETDQTEYNSLNTYPLPGRQFFNENHSVALFNFYWIICVQMSKFLQNNRRKSNIPFVSLFAWISGGSIRMRVKLGDFYLKYSIWSHLLFLTADVW